MRFKRAEERRQAIEAEAETFLTGRFGAETGFTQAEDMTIFDRPDNANNPGSWPQLESEARSR